MWPARNWREGECCKAWRTKVAIGPTFVRTEDGLFACITGEAANGPRTARRSSAPGDRS